MTLRTKSRARQGAVWLCAAFALLVAYAVLSACLYGTVGWNPFDYRYHRLMLPLAVLFVLVARETRWDGVVRADATESRKIGRGEEVAKEEGERRNRAQGSAGRVTHAHTWAGGGETRVREVTRTTEESGDRPSPLPHTFIFSSPQNSPSTSSPTGEELFERARAIRHQPIPDFEFDGEYLGLLGKSAAAGYAPALAKLGEYAMRRAAWVEAYYWMTMARRNGMHGLSPTLREIRQNWAKGGFPNESGNVSGIFPEAAGSLGRALLHLESGHEAVVARAFLKTHYPDLLVE